MMRAAAFFVVGVATVCVAQDDPLGIIVIRDGDRQVQQVRETLERHGYADSPLAKAIKQNPDLVRAQVGLLGITSLAGVDPWEGIGLLLGEEMMIGLAPGEDEEPRVVGVTRLRDPDKADKVIDAVLAVAGITAGGEPQEGMTRTIAGQTVYIADELMLCRTQDMLVLANDRAMMKDALLDAADGEVELFGGIGSAIQTVPDAATMWLALDVATLRAAGMEIPEKQSNALGGLLFGGWARSLSDADRVVAWTTTQADGLEFTVDVHRDGAWPQTHRGFLASNDDHIPLDIENTIAELMVTRHWDTLFGERESLLTLEGSSQIVEFATGLTAVMGQLDFIDEVLPRVNGPVRLIAVNRDAGELDVDPTPTLPALALIMSLDLEGVDLAQRLYSGGQMLMTIVNFERAQQGKPSMIMDMADHRGVRLVTGAFGAPMGDAEVVGPEYNFEPALAVVDGHLVVASTRTLLTSIVDQVLDADDGGADHVQDRMRVNAGQLAEILRQNRAELITNDMLEKGKTREQATRDIDAVLAGLALVDSVRINADVTESGGRATLRVTLDGE